MIPRKSCAVIAAAVSLLSMSEALMPSVVSAVPFDNRPKLLLHVRPQIGGNPCSGWGDLANCTLAHTNARVAGPTGPFYFVYLLAATGPLRGTPLGGNGLGIAGIQFGVQYDGRPGLGVEIFNWTLCATLQFALSDWPGAGSGNLITWDPVNRCQLGEVGVAGYFYCAAYTPDVLNLIPRPVDQLARVADCNVLLSSPTVQAYDLTDSDLGSVVFSTSGALPGCNPCLAPCNASVSTVGASWSQIKSLY